MYTSVKSLDRLISFKNKVYKTVKVTHIEMEHTHDSGDIRASLGKDNSLEIIVYNNPVLYKKLVKTAETLNKLE